MQSFPPKVPLDYMSPPAPIDPGYGKFERSNYFQSYRNEYISRIQVRNRYLTGLHHFQLIIKLISIFQMPPSEKYANECTYTPVSNTVSSKYLKMTEPLFSMIDHGRHEEVDNFYIVMK